MFEVGTVLRPRSTTGTVMVVIAVDGDTVTYAPKGWESSSALHRTASMAKLSAAVAEQPAPEPTEEEFASVVIPPDAFGALALAADYATAAYDVDVYKGDPKNGNLVANYTVIGFEEARAIAARFTEDGRQCVIQRFDKQPLIGEFDYWCKKIGAYPYTASDGRTYPAIRQEVTA